jgi:hypothetical protein
MLDIGMLLLVVVFFSLTIGYAGLCDRLFAASAEHDRDAS